MRPNPDPQPAQMLINALKRIIPEQTEESRALARIFAEKKTAGLIHILKAVAVALDVNDYRAPDPQPYEKEIELPLASLKSKRNLSEVVINDQTNLNVKEVLFDNLVLFLQCVSVADTQLTISFDPAKNSISIQSDREFPNNTVTAAACSNFGRKIKLFRDRIDINLNIDQASSEQIYTFAEIKDLPANKAVLSHGKLVFEDRTINVYANFSLKGMSSLKDLLHSEQGYIAGTLVIGNEDPILLLSNTDGHNGCFKLKRALGIGVAEATYIKLRFKEKAKHSSVCTEISIAHNCETTPDLTRLISMLVGQSNDDWGAHA